MFMLEKDRFKFEDKERDFPFYKGNPLLSKKAWIVLRITFWWRKHNTWVNNNTHNNDSAIIILS